MLVFLFSSFAIRAVGKAAYYVINEVRRQFKENPGILLGTVKPDYRQCVDIVTVGALKQTGDVEERGFAGAGGRGQRHQLARIDREVGLVEHGELAGRIAVVTLDSDQPKDRCPSPGRRRLRFRAHS